MLLTSLLTLRCLPCAASEPVTYADIPYGPMARQTLDIYQPSSSNRNGNSIVFFYGGNWQQGDKKDYKFVGQTLAQRGILTIIPNYRLYPASPFPTFISDAAMAIRWTYDHAASYGGNGSSLYLMGHGSGASMTLLLALDSEYLNHVGMSAGNIRGIICIAGFYGHDMLLQPSLASMIADIHDPNTLLADRYVTSRSPPILIIASRDEDISDGSGLGELKHAIDLHGGTIKVMSYPNLGRVGIMLPFSPLFHSRSSVVDDIMDFINGPS